LGNPNPMPMIRIVNTLLLVISSLLLQAQKPPIKFGDVPLEQLKMTVYEKDSSAAAVVLADYGESIIAYTQGIGFTLKFERITRIKILSKDGLDRANFSIPLFHSGGSDEKLSGLKAVTYNLENGKVVESKLKSEAVFKEKYDANIDITKITLPNVKVGSVIEITYRVLSDFVVNFQDWEFQRDIPVVLSEYRATVPEYFNYDKYMQGYIVLSANEHSRKPNSITINSSERTGDPRGAVNTTFSSDRIDFQEDHFRWVAVDVPAFKSEPYITTPRDYISKINFELSFTQFPNQPVKTYLGNWENVNNAYADSPDFGGQVTGNGFLKKNVEAITAGLTTPEEKMDAICNYVKQTIDWNELNRKYVSTSFKKVLDEKKGNSADINLLLASMLNKADLDVFPVLLSTRDHGFVREATPAESQFNYVVCLVRVGEKNFLLDATDKLLPTGTLPERCLNGNGLMIAKEGFEWIKLQSPGKSRRAVNVDLVLDDTGELKGNLKLDRTGYYAQAARENYFSKGEADYVKDFLGSRSWTLNKSEFQNDKEVKQAFKETHEISIADHSTTAGEMIYINPFIMEQQITNPFKLEQREYPVDYGSPFENIYLLKVQLPDGYTVEEAPKSKVMTLPGSAAKYLYNVVQTGNSISISSNLTINQSLFTQDEYPNLREFYNQMVAKQAEQIVLKKK
jgi:transglutaminase-like putative cysteine protease